MNNQNNLQYQKINAEQLKTISSDFTKKTKDDIKCYIILCLLLTLFVCIMLILIITYFAKNGSNIEIFNKDISDILLVLLVLSCGLFAYIYVYIESHKNNGRTLISIKVNYDENYVNDKMHELLKQLYYKEKKYKDGKVFYAFRDRYTMNTVSKKRCISYTFKENILTIEAWAYMMGRELPIDNRRYGDIVKRALAYDLEYIVNNIKN